MDTIDPVEKLYQRSARHGVTMADICVRAKVAATTPSRWKHDRNAPNWDTLRKLNAALDAIVTERGDKAA